MTLNTTMLGIDGLKQEEGKVGMDLAADISENELKYFCDSLANSQNCDTKLHYTLDYFDTSIGILYSRENPTSLNFCVALLREILCNLKPSHELWDKIKYAAFLLNLATRNVEFNVLYEIYHQIEDVIHCNNLAWSNDEVRDAFDQKITEKLIVKDDVCSLPDVENRIETDFLETKTNYEASKTENNFDYNEDSNGSMDYGDYPVKDDENIDIKEELPLKKKKEPIKRKLPKEKKPRKLKEKVEKKKKKEKPLPNLDKIERDKLKIPCLQCKFKTRRQADLDKHVFEKHETNRLCTQCGHLSNTYKDYIKHNETHLFTCEVCNLKILGVRTLKQHMKIHETKQENGVEGGGSGVGDAEAVNGGDNHIVDENGVKRVPCDICGVLLLEQCVKQHILQVHSTEVHKCDLCDYVANTKYKVTDHKRRHFLECGTCPECGKTVKNLKRHFRRNCGSKKERFFCHLCEKSFAFKESLSKHIKNIHQKILDHHCHLCEYKTYKKFNLKLHISKMHTKVDMKKLCNFCNQSTSNLEYHIKIYHYKEHLESRNIIENVKK